MRYFPFLIVLLVMSSGVSSQEEVCTGSFGPNVFTTGDFGSGLATILPVDPGYAPGFQYSTNVPFHDGIYTITNDMGAWPDNWPTWLGIGDNSSDPLGYMMVVNASYAPGIFYEQTVEGLCSGTVYEVSFDVINIVKTGTTGHILPDVSLLLNDSLVLTTGPLPQDEKWHHFNLYISNVTDDLKVTLRNNAPGGTGNDLAIDNISFRPCGPRAGIVNDMPGKICENSLFPKLSVDIADFDSTSAIQWQISYDAGSTWDNIVGATDVEHVVQQLSAGFYMFRYLWAANTGNLSRPLCHVRSETTVVEVVPVEFRIVDTLCEGLYFTLGDIAYGETGVYQEHLISSIGCDSIVTLELTVVPDPAIGILPTTRPPSCHGGDDAAIWLDSVLYGAPPYIVRVNGFPPGTAADTFFAQSGTYALEVEDRFGCTADAIAITGETEPFAITGLHDTLIRLGHIATLAPEFNKPLGSVMWEGPNISCAGCPVTDVRPFSSTEYAINAISSAGCIAQSRVRVDVDDVLDIYCANAFSPNGDGTNDTWEVAVDHRSIDRIAELTIFDRWGGVVYQVRDGSPLAFMSWDGMRDGVEVPPGVYSFVVKLLVVNGETVVKSGTITLLR